MRFVRSLLLAATALMLTAGLAAAQVSITTNITTNTTWGPTGTVVGSTFWVKNSISINSGATLYIQPGVVVKFNPGCYIAVVGGLRVMGTNAQNVIFTSIKDDNNPAGDTNGDGNATTPNTGDWYGIQFSNTSLNNSSGLYYGDFRYAGYANTGALIFPSVSDSVVNCTIRKSYYGVDCQGTASPVLSNTSIQASTQTPIVLDFTATPVFSNLVFSSSDNGYDAFGLRGGTLTGTATLPKRGATVGLNPVNNVTYVLLGALTINAGASLTINPGVVVKPTLGAYFNVNGNLTANGTAAVGDTITITSINDDNFGVPNDTNNNGSITAPNRGDWSGIIYNAGATGSVSYARLRFGNNSVSQGVVMMTNLSIPVTNSLITDGAHGLALFGVSNPVVTNVQINNMSSTPILMSVSANPTFTNIGLLANAVTALGIQGEAVGVDGHLSPRNIGGFTNITYYLQNGALHMLNGATLTIDPGIVIKNQISSGGIQVDGALVANGTVGSPIIFTSLYDDLYGNPADTNGDGSTTTPAQGNWSYLWFTDTSNDATSKLNFCRVAYGSYGPFDGWPCGIRTTNASPTITNTFIFKCYYGIRVEGNSAPVISNDTFDNLGAAPIVMSVQSDPQIATNNLYSTNVYNAIALLSETMSQSSRLKYRPNVGNPASPTFCYMPTGQITIPAGVNLAVDPQVILKPVSSFTVFDVSGALNLVGSNNTTNRIFFTSVLDDALGGDTTPTNAATPTAGNWGDIEFEDTATDPQCIVRNVKFQFGAASGNVGGVLTTHSASPRFANLEFFQNRTAFTFTGTSAPSLDSLNIFNCTALPIVSSLISAPVYGNTITFANNSYLGLGILGETIAQDVLTGVGKIGPYSNLNYILAGNPTIAFGAKWTINPGVVLKFGRYFTGDPTGGAITVDGAISAKGKPDSLIIFTSLADDAFGQDVMGDGAATVPTAAQWGGIQLNAVSNDAAMAFDWCRFRYGGYTNGPLYMISASPTLNNTQFSQNYYTSVQITGASTPTFNSCDFDSCTTGGAAGLPVFMSIVSDPVFNNCRFLGNSFTALGILNENIAQDVLWKIRSVAGRQNMPYFLTGTLTIGLGATLTMQPGVQVKMYSGAITVQRAMTAVGRTQPESLIVFTSYRDDFYGGDTNNDGSTGVPNQGDWGSIWIDGTAIDAQVNFRNCVFRYGGSGTTQGAIRCVNSSPAIDSCLFANNAVGISVEGASNPTIHGCSLYSNFYYAVNNTGNAFCVAADGNWWGSASGPNDASAVADLCAMGANAGTGDIVSNNVDYLPFATSGIQNPLLGDISLNGSVLAYDASLALQYAVSLIPLNSLQLLVGNVDNASSVNAFDASLILQYVSGAIKAFPAASSHAQQVPPGALAAQELVRRAQGRFAVSLGTAVRGAGEWLVPVHVTGDAPVYSVEVQLADGSAATLGSVEMADAGRGLDAMNTDGGIARAAVAGSQELTPGDVMTLHFPDNGKFQSPNLAWARVNAVELPMAPKPVVPSISMLGRPAPNPATGPASLALAVSSADAAGRVSVRIVDVTGRAVRTLVDGTLEAGTHTLQWNLSDDSGHLVPAGLYFVRARVGSTTLTQRMTVVR